jgi:hypothetical protein
MAEFLEKKKKPLPSGYARMGQPLPETSRSAAYKHCRAMGLSSAESWACVQGVAEQLERDVPYEAMQAGMLYLDLTGVYRLFAVLLTQ